MKTLTKLPLFLLLVGMLTSTGLMAQRAELQYFRKWDKDGINVFEPSKKADQPAYDGFQIRIGGSFTQDFQSLTHSNTPTVAGDKLYGVITDPTDAKFDTTSAKLQGFNLAMANLNFDFQIADGIRVSLENYMSARHHNEFWVKGGYIQIDKLPMFNNPEWFTNNFRVKIGHFTPNFGDQHFRRSDGGNAIFNPFVENFIMDAFTTEIGGEIYYFPTSDLMVMGGMTSGFINGNIEQYGANNNSSGVVPTKKTPSIFGKVAYDKQFNDDLRFRLSASAYFNPNIQRNTLYAGDRTGSHYFLMMEKVGSTAVANFTSGRFNPSMANRITAIMINPFVKFKGLEVFGSYEILNGAAYSDVKTDANGEKTWENRAASQFSVEGLYRFLKDEQAYVGARYTGMTAELPGIQSDGSFNEASINRLAVAAGWFPTKNLLLKVEYVNQDYVDFTDFRKDGNFNGFVVEAVIGF